jgi:hypothetical protein
MKRLSLLTLFILVVCFSISGQESSNCPTIKVNSPSEMTPINSAMLFSVSITGNFDNSILEYNWMVSAGKIADGHGTVAILVPTNRDIAGETIIATVKIKGLPEDCQSLSSGKGSVDSPPIWDLKIDQYGRLSLNDEFNRLDSFLNHLNESPTAKGLIVFSITKNPNCDSQEDKKQFCNT